MGTSIANEMIAMICTNLLGNILISSESKREIPRLISAIALMRGSISKLL
jgi:hypothetical protein